MKDMFVLVGFYKTSAVSSIELFSAASLWSNQRKPSNYTGVDVNELQTLLPYWCHELERSNLIKEVTSKEMKVLFGMLNEKLSDLDGYTRKHNSKKLHGLSLEMS